MLAQSGDGRTLARATLDLPAGAREATAAMVLPPELRNRLGRLVLEGPPSAGLGGAAGRTLAAAAGGDPRRRPRHRRHAVRRLAVLPAARTVAVHRSPRGRSRHAAAARDLGADPRGPAAAGGRRARCADPLGGAGRPADPLRRPAHGRTADRRDRFADAGEAARRRPPAWRGAVLGGTRRAWRSSPPARRSPA